MARFEKRCDRSRDTRPPVDQCAEHVEAQQFHFAEISLHRFAPPFVAIPLSK